MLGRGVAEQPLHRREDRSKAAAACGDGEPFRDALECGVVEGKDEGPILRYLQKYSTVVESLGQIG
jgi:hypothetical protein